MPGNPNVGWLLLVTGLLLAGLGVLWLSVPWLGRLPGDIAVERGNWRFYFPLGTCIVLSIVLSLVIWLVRRFNG